MGDMLSFPAHHCSFDHRAHLEQAAEALTYGEIIIAGFNGVFGIFGDADSPHAAESIFKAKQRPKDKGLVLVCPPEYLHEFVDTCASMLASWYSLEQVQHLLREVHALGVILPAAPAGTPSHLVQHQTILNIWSEYPPYSPFRQIVRFLRERGGRALMGTSANKSGCTTCTTPDQVQATFQYDAALFFPDTFDHLPPFRRVSTSIIDLTGESPRLHRAGSMPTDEINRHLQRSGFPELETLEDSLRMQPAALQQHSVLTFPVQ